MVKKLTFYGENYRFRWDLWFRKNIFLPYHGKQQFSHFNLIFPERKASTRPLTSQIDDGRVKHGKSSSQLFALASFKSKRYLVNEAEIYAYYRLKTEKAARIEKPISPNGESSTKLILTIQPAPKPKPPKQVLDLNPAKTYIYEHLITNNKEFIGKNEFITFILNEIPDYHSKISTLYAYYKKEFNRYHKHAPVMPAVEPDIMLKYPFRSKIDDYEEGIDKGYFTAKFNIEPLDKQPKKLKNEYMRPSFSPYPYSWEIDHLQYNKERVTYLFCLNINTRYLYVIPVNGKSAQATKKALNTLIEAEMKNFNHPVKNIRGDGDKGFESIKRDFPDINFYFSGSKFTYHNKLIDAVMRTLRNALNNDNLWDGQHDDIIQQLVYYYNFTTHRVIKMKPIDLHSDIDKEWAYIREKTEELNDVKMKQINAGMFNYKPGDRLRVHLDYSKTSESFAKRRRQFDRIGTFICYVGGNCRVKLGQNEIVDVPIYFTIKI